MREVAPARETRTSIEIREFRGRNDTHRRYLILRGHVGGRDFFKAFTAAEVKGACIDILGVQDTAETRRRQRAGNLARKVWKGGGSG